MQFRARDPDPEGKFLSQFRLELLAKVFPREAVAAVLAECHCLTRWERKLNLQVTLIQVIAMSLYAQAPLEDVLEKLAHRLRLLWPDEDRRPALLPGKPAICYRRYQLRVRPGRTLLHQLCRPLATPTTRGAFLFGLRLIAIDGHTQDVPDTKENAAAFGRPATDRGDSASPQVRGVSLCELGTHAVVDTTFRARRP